MEFEQETNEKKEEETVSSQGMKQWFQDNLRIIVSVVIVVLIAGGIYSYSNRSVAPENKSNEVSNDVLSNLSSQDQTDSATEENADQEAPKDQAAAQQPGQKTEQKAQPTQETAKGASQETDGSFIETAGQGDSLTRLARKALSDYLEKNPDSTLTAEHKIYIEDYLRKNVSTKGHVSIGSSVEFSKSLISDAVSKSKNLSGGQLKNLHKYAVRVPSLK